MTNTSLDFSRKTELRWLGKLVQQLQAAADAMPFFIAGAMARDLILQHGYYINTGRVTRDVDFAIQMESWETFEQLRSRLVGTGKFAAQCFHP